MTLNVHVATCYDNDDDLQPFQCWAGWTSRWTWWKVIAWSWNVPAGVGRRLTWRGDVAIQLRTSSPTWRRRRSSAMSLSLELDWRWPSNTSPWPTTASMSVSLPTRSVPPMPPFSSGSKVSTFSTVFFFCSACLADEQILGKGSPQLVSRIALSYGVKII